MSLGLSHIRSTSCRRCSARTARTPCVDGRGDGALAPVSTAVCSPSRVHGSLPARRTRRRRPPAVDERRGFCSDPSDGCPRSWNNFILAELLFFPLLVRSKKRPKSPSALQSQRLFPARPNLSKRHERLARQQVLLCALRCGGYGERAAPLGRKRKYRRKTVRPPSHQAQTGARRTQ